MSFCSIYDVCHDCQLRRSADENIKIAKNGGLNKHEDYLQGMITASQDEEKTYHRILHECIGILGNGDEVKGMKILWVITDRLTHARNKHPHFADDITHAVHLLQDEGDEVTKALLVETDDRVIDETLDVIAVGVRLLGGEYSSESEGE